MRVVKKIGQFQGVSGGCNRVVHGVLASRESKRDGVPGMGWNSGGKIYDFTVVPGPCPLGDVWGRVIWGLKSTLI